MLGFVGDCSQIRGYGNKGMQTVRTQLPARERVCHESEPGGWECFVNEELETPDVL
jgi:hypothetical protein